jgi:hypothetical protein
MKKLLLVCFALFVLASNIWGDGTFADAEEEQNKAEQQRKEEQEKVEQQRKEEQEKAERRRQEKLEEERRRKNMLIDGGWSESTLHVFAYGLAGVEFDKFGGGFGFDWQPFRNFAWTFFNTDFFNDRINLTTLATAVWRPYSFEVTASVGIGGSVDLNEEREDHKFLFIGGVSIGYHLGPGVIYAGVLYSEVHNFSISIGYKY